MLTVSYLSDNYPGVFPSEKHYGWPELLRGLCLLVAFLCLLGVFAKEPLLAIGIVVPLLAGGWLKTS